jgi:hypothetical protein
MNRLQTCQGWMSRTDMNSDPLINGSVAAIRKTLQRLENRGLLVVVERPGFQGKPTKLYKALSSRACGGSQEVSHLEEIPCNNKDSKWDTTPGTEKCPIKAGTDAPKWDTTPLNDECPIKESSAGAGSDANGTDSVCSRAREESSERSREELKALQDNAWGQWDA